MSVALEAAIGREQVEIPGKHAPRHRSRKSVYAPTLGKMEFLLGETLVRAEQVKAGFARRAFGLEITPCVPEVYGSGIQRPIVHQESPSGAG